MVLSASFERRSDNAALNWSIAWLPWETVRRGLGGLLEPVGLFPERYRFRDPLRVEQLASLLA